jgi:hypothetical protein
MIPHDPDNPDCECWECIKARTEMEAVLEK